MLVAILTKPWWKSLVKGNDEEEVSDHQPSAEEREEEGAPESMAVEAAEVLAASAEEVQEEAGEETPAPRETRRGREGRREGRGNQRRRGERRPVDEREEEEGEEQEETLNAEETHHDEDPFAPAYDLEHGRPIQERVSSGAALPWKSKIKTPKDFFAEELLYRFDILERQDRDELRGKYRVELKGFKGGIWTVDLGDELTVVNRREEAEIVLTMQQKDFIHLVNGEMNPQLLILAQKLKVQGDIRKAVKFENLLVPSSE